MYKREVKWFEFEVHQRQDQQKVSIPAEDYKDALNKIKRIHPNCMVSFVKQWTDVEKIAQPSSSAKPRANTKQQSAREKKNSKAQHQEQAPQNKSSTAKTTNETPFWQVLGVDQDASLAEIKKAYVQRLKEYHPDRVADLGPELKQLAEQKTFEILKAFNDARRALDTTQK